MTEPLPEGFRDDRLYEPVTEVVAELLAEGDEVRPIDVLVRLELVTPEAVEQWRTGRLPYLERGIVKGLSRVSRILRLLRSHAQELGLVPAPGQYKRSRQAGKGRLRFSKAGDAASEAAYSCHFRRAGVKSATTTQKRSTPTVAAAEPEPDSKLGEPLPPPAEP